MLLFLELQWNLLRTLRGRPRLLKGNLKKSMNNQDNCLYLSIICFYQMVMFCFLHEQNSSGLEKE